MFLLLAILLFALAALSPSSPGAASTPEVALVEMASAEQGEREPGPVFYVFGGQKMSLNLKLTGPTRATATIEARLFPVANGLSAPLAPALLLGEVTFDHLRSAALTVDLPFPKVARRVEMAVQLGARIGGKTQTHTIGTVHFFVYPEDLVAPLRVWALQMEREASPALGVFGKSEELRSFFKENKVAFEDLGEKIPPPSNRKMLFVGDATPADVEAWQRRLPVNAEARFVIFTEDPWRLPGVYTTLSQRLRVTKATLPILKRLPIDPLHQVSLVEILTQSYSVAPLTTPIAP